MIDYLVWRKDWHASSLQVDLILPSRDCIASRELSQGRGRPRGVGRLPWRNSSSREILPRHLGKEQAVGSKPRSRSRMNPLGASCVWKNSVVMKGCKEDRKQLLFFLCSSAANCSGFSKTMQMNLCAYQHLLQCSIFPSL